MSRKYTPATFQPTVRPDWGGVLSYIPNDEKATILECIIKYPSLDSNSRFWVETIKPDLDLQYETFKKQCEAKSRGVRNRWGKTSTTSVKDDNKKSNTNVIVSEGIGIGIGIGIEERKVKRFKKPTIEEIKSYCMERNNGVDAERFFDFYESKGWKVGNQPMKDWKAAVRNWENKNIKPQEEVFDLKSEQRAEEYKLAELTKQKLEQQIKEKWGI